MQDTVKKKGKRHMLLGLSLIYFMIGSRGGVGVD
jgi:hypothetical protein